MSNIYQTPQEVDFNELKKYIETNKAKKQLKVLLLHLYLAKIEMDCIILLEMF